MVRKVGKNSPWSQSEGGQNNEASQQAGANQPAAAANQQVPDVIQQAHQDLEENPAIPDAEQPAHGANQPDHAANQPTDNLNQPDQGENEEVPEANQEDHGTKQLSQQVNQPNPLTNQPYYANNQPQPIMNQPTVDQEVSDADSDEIEVAKEAIHAEGAGAEEGACGGYSDQWLTDLVTHELNKPDSESEASEQGTSKQEASKQETRKQGTSEQGTSEMEKCEIITISSDDTSSSDSDRMAVSLPGSPGSDRRIPRAQVAPVLGPSEATYVRKPPPPVQRSTAFQPNQAVSHRTPLPPTPRTLAPPPNEVVFGTKPLPQVPRSTATSPSNEAVFEHKPLQEIPASPPMLTGSPRSRGFPSLKQGASGTASLPGGTQRSQEASETIYGSGAVSLPMSGNRFPRGMGSSGTGSLPSEFSEVGSLPSRIPTTHESLIVRVLHPSPSRRRGRGGVDSSTAGIEPELERPSKAARMDRVTHGTVPESRESLSRRADSGDTRTSAGGIGSDRTSPLASVVRMNQKTLEEMYRAGSIPKNVRFLSGRPDSTGSSSVSSGIGSEVSSSSGIGSSRGSSASCGQSHTSSDFSSRSQTPSSASSSRSHTPSNTRPSTSASSWTEWNNAEILKENFAVAKTMDTLEREKKLKTMMFAPEQEREQREEEESRKLRVELEQEEKLEETKRETTDWERKQKAQDATEQEETEMETTERQQTEREQKAREQEGK